MKKFRGMYMTKEEYINWQIENLKAETRHFITTHGDANLKLYYSELIDNIEIELVELGFTWEELEEISISAMKEYDQQETQEILCN